MACGGGIVAVAAAIVTFLSEIDDAIAAGVGKVTAGVGIAAIGQSGIVERGFADLVECALHDTVTAGSALKETLGRAAIVIACIAVVAFFLCLENAISA
jgi:hypothetical protein